VDGEICGASGSTDAPGAHSTCTLVAGVAGELLRRVEAQGRRAPSELHGTFAAAIHEPRDGLLTLCRDRSGVKPLYYVLAPENGVGLAFSTSLRALAGLVPRPVLSTEAVASFLANGFVMEPMTMLAGARALLPGQSLTIRLDGSVLETNSYRKPSGSARAAGAPEPAPEKSVRSRLVESVARLLPREQRYCLLLSGGVDSSTLAAVVRRDLGQPLDTFSLVFDDEELSESKYSRAVAAKLGTNHHEVLLQERQFVDALEGALESLDQPTTDALNGYSIARECQRAGFEVCFAGIGSDELFGGHSCFQRVPRAVRGLRSFHRLPAPLRNALRRLAPHVLRSGAYDMPSAGIRGKLVSLLDQQPEVLPVYVLGRRVLLPELAARLVCGETAARVNAMPPELAQYMSALVAGGTDIREQISVYEQVLYLCNQLLRDLEGVSASLSIRFRLPFVDQTLTEAVGRIRPAERFRGPLPKQLLIDSVKDILPTEAYLRPKLGFVLPIGRWLAGELSARFDVLVEDAEFVRSVGLDPQTLRLVCQDCRAAGGEIFYTRLWSVFILLDWCRRTGLRAILAPSAVHDR
jgi:asparagine synthase (glutamine-hydrolysing)